MLLIAKSNLNKTGVNNDPLGQPTVLAGSDSHLISKLWDVRTYGRTDTMCENSDHYRLGLWSASWINKMNFLNYL